MVPRRIRYVLRSDRTGGTRPPTKSPTKTSPSASGPSPQSLQKARPVIPTGSRNLCFGRIRGIGPLLFVLGQFALDPQPWLPPLRMRFTSSLHSGPLSVCQSLPPIGSNANPMELRIPYAQTLVWNGLSDGIDPSGLMRRIFPRKLAE